jgi:hypothetical protein
MPSQLGPIYILCLSILATAGLVLMWAAFWKAASVQQESIRGILLSAAFFKTVVVMGVIAATVVLSLADRLDSGVAGTILGGIVGYVLGQSEKGA